MSVHDPKLDQVGIINFHHQPSTHPSQSELREAKATAATTGPPANGKGEVKKSKENNDKKKKKKKQKKKAT